MTIVTRLELGSRDLSPHRSESRCEYQIVVADHGQQWLQVSTFGSAESKTDGVKQTIQFTESAITELREILNSLEAANPS
jgi:hypothetical protein